MKPGDLIKVSGKTSVNFAEGKIGIIIQLFVKDNAAWVLLPGIGKKYIKISALTKIQE